MLQRLWPLWLPKPGAVQATIPPSCHNPLQIARQLDFSDDMTQ